MQRSAKIPTMGCTWRTAHCRDFLLAVADVCFICAQAILLSEGVRLGHSIIVRDFVVRVVQQWR